MDDKETRSTTEAAIGTSRPLRTTCPSCGHSIPCEADGTFSHDCPALSILTKKRAFPRDGPSRLAIGAPVRCLDKRVDEGLRRHDERMESLLKRIVRLQPLTTKVRHHSDKCVLCDACGQRVPERVLKVHQAEDCACAFAEIKLRQLKSATDTESAAQFWKILSSRVRNFPRLPDPLLLPLTRHQIDAMDRAVHRVEDPGAASGKVSRRLRPLEPLDPIRAPTKPVNADASPGESAQRREIMELARLVCQGVLTLTEAAADPTSLRLVKRGIAS